jgi:hypothetical protein
MVNMTKLLILAHKAAIVKLTGLLSQFCDAATFIRLVSYALSWYGKIDQAATLNFIKLYFN